MKTSRNVSALTGALVLAAGAVAETPKDMAVTIYNDNFGVVKEQREMSFERGLNRMQFTGVAERIDPTSVNFLCLTDPDAVSILEQNYEYDLVNTDSLLKRYIDQPVSLLVKGSGSSGASLLKGVLTAAIGGDLIVQDESSGQLHIVSRASVERIELDKKPEDLLTRPTLVWLAHAEKPGKHLCQVTYTTEAIGWKADYSAVLNDKEDALDFSGWVTINNQSGAAYPDATIKLIAGDVRRLQPPVQPRPESIMVRSAMAADAAGFEEKPFMEYHLYTLGRKSTLQNRQIKQIELIETARGVPVDKHLVYTTSINQWQVRQSDKVQVKIEFENEEQHGLGIALPKGRVRVFKADPADGTLEFVGEDQIDHTARRERLSLYIGDAFDVVPEQKITDQRRGDRFVTFTRSVEIRNRKEEPVSVFVDEIIPRYVNWRIDKSSLPYEKKDAFTCRFKVDVNADSTTTLTFTMTQTW
ncbi:MAG TPA: DUF4139 domain-containing protein [Phycisphaerales bacterium]|nr:DUF4139 domain-containing protein [Phycisphaerales bacterium]